MKGTQIPASVFGQLPTNTSCSTAISIPVHSSLNYTQGKYNVGALPGHVGLPNNFPCNVVFTQYVPTSEVWYHTTNLTNGMILYVKTDQPANVEIYTNTCNNLIYDTCTTMSNGDTAIIFLNNLASTSFFIRVLGYARYGTHTTGSNMWIGAVSRALPNRVISKKITAPWDSNSTWVGNVKPNYNDTVIIDDGATITAIADRLPGIAKLIVGQSDTSHTANLLLKYNGFFWQAPDSLIVRQQGNLAIQATDPRSNGTLQFSMGKYFKLDGKILADTNTNYHFTSLYFNKPGKQVMEGKGSLINEWIVTVSKSRGDTLFQRIPWRIRVDLNLDSGIVKSGAPITFLSKPTDLPGSSLYCNLNIINGSIINPNLRANGSYNLSVWDVYSQPDSTKDLNPYFIPNQQLVFKDYRDFAANISGNKTIQFNGGYSNQILQYTMKSKIIGGLTDTIFVGRGVAQVSSYSRYRFSSGFAVGSMVFDPRLVTSVEDTNYLPLFKFGAFRQLKIINSKPFAARAQTLGVTVLPQAPNGTVNAPLKYMFGSFVYKIHSNRDSLPLASSLGFLFTPRDSFITSPTYLRIAQAPSPSGPWTNISTGTINASHIITNTGINLQNGQYFAFGTVDPGQDLSLDWVETTTPALTGPGMPGQNMQMQIRNPGSTAATEAFVTWTIASPTPITGSSTISLNPPLQGGDSTIINLNPADLIYVP